MTQNEINRFIELVERYISGDFLTEEELDFLESGMQEKDCLKALDEKMSEELEAKQSTELASESISAPFQEDALARFQAKIERSNGKHVNDQPVHPFDSSDPPGRFRFWNKGIAAAVIGTLLLVTGFTFYQLKKEDGSLLLANNHKKYQRTVPIAAGSSGAILTLGNGKKIALGAVQKGLIQIGSLTIQQNKGAAVLSNKLEEEGPVAYNTLSTPRGRQFQVELPDGTKVWLNASSTLRFPTAFNKENRTVELSGEAYFEVRHNEQRPFLVKVKGKLIEDIGTKFNVKAYRDENIMMTALVEGAVDVSNGLQKLRLSPGEQVTANDQHMTVSKADLGQILAWKAGFFAFQNASVEEIMRQLSRWYDVDIAYGSEMNIKESKSQRFTGRIDGSLDLQELLDGLQFSQMHFKIDKNKRTIIIQN